MTLDVPPSAAARRSRSAISHSSFAPSVQVPASSASVQPRSDTKSTARGSRAPSPQRETEEKTEGPGARAKATGAAEEGDEEEDEVAVPHNKGQRNFRLQRFTEAQKQTYQKALIEIRAGRKSSCWMWYVIPTPPHIVNGVEKGSSINRKFALRSDDEVKAYLAFEADGVSLRRNYLEIMTAVRDQLRSGTAPNSLVGSFDLPKLASSAALFERVTRDDGDTELNNILAEVLSLLPQALRN